MSKVELKLLGISYSQTQAGSYIVILSELDSDRKLPVVVRPFEAQYITFKIEGLKLQKPLTQDFFKMFAKSFNIDVSEIYIYDVSEGIFSAKMIASNVTHDSEIECSIGDAISMSILFKCPITCEESVLNKAGVYMNNDGSTSEEHKKINSQENRNTSVTLDSLKDLLQKALEDEEYEAAAQIRDRIREIEEKS
jgi:bifunctional DNase/RNase